MPAPPDKVIAAAAKDVLQPLGFRRRGRSRLWIADHHWWLNVVEFQPSGWSKGSYVNVAAHWLWSNTGHLSFDHGGRAGGFAEGFDTQFEAAVRTLAEAAAEEARRLANVIRSILETADLLKAAEMSLPDRSRGSWSAYHAAMAAGLAGRSSDATALFKAVMDDRVKVAADPMAPLTNDPDGFRHKAEALIAKQRRMLGLDALTHPLF